MCPLADPGDQQAFEACRQALFRGSLLRASLGAILLWGRPHPMPGESLKETRPSRSSRPKRGRGSMRPCSCSTAAGASTTTPANGFIGHASALCSATPWIPASIPIRSGTTPRSGATTRAPTRLMLWIAPQSGSIVVGAVHQRRAGAAGLKEPARRAAAVRRTMDVDRRHRATPSRRRRCFAGCSPTTTPISGSSSRAIASSPTPCARATATIAMCRTNPNRMNRLVLLQTPVHAASEIKRLMKIGARQRNAGRRLAALSRHRSRHAGRAVGLRRRLRGHRRCGPRLGGGARQAALIDRERCPSPCASEMTGTVDGIRARQHLRGLPWRLAIKPGLDQDLGVWMAVQFGCPKRRCPSRHERTVRSRLPPPDPSSHSKHAEPRSRFLSRFRDFEEAY